jgi:hypothetical protein
MGGKAEIFKICGNISRFIHKTLQGKQADIIGYHIKILTCNFPESAVFSYSPGIKKPEFFAFFFNSEGRVFKIPYFYEFWSFPS